MANVYSKALDKTIQVERVIGHLAGSEPGPTLIFTAGIHGNEPSGVFALHHVIADLRSKKVRFRGNLYAIAGNLNALETQIRYQEEDLNRMWTEERMNDFRFVHNADQPAEVFEQSEIQRIISGIISKEAGPFYFIDLHTTSSPTQPFITVNDTLLNRKFTQQYPAPLLLGIEEYLDGTLLNHINQLGYVAFGFESGQHDASSAIENHIAFVYLTLIFAGCISKKEVDFQTYYDLLAYATKDLADTYEIVYHYKIAPNENFSMRPGFNNFEAVLKGKEIARSNGNSVYVPVKGSIFMPLYQKQGEDGFFVIKPIPAIFLNLSTLLRQLHFDYVLPLLPGVSWVSEKRNALKVDLGVARFLAKKLFHLLGYRSRRANGDYMIIKNREAGSKTMEYKEQRWY